MNLPLRFYILCSLLLALTSCSNTVTSAQSNSTPDADAVKLIALSEQAMQIAQKSHGEILRQIDTDLTTTDFRFVDSSLTKEITVIVPEPDALTDKWSTVVNSVSPLLGYAEAAINLQSLKVGPNRMAQAITTHWPGCKIRGLTLYRENDKLNWVAFCNTSEGVVSGSMDGQTGIFQPSDAPPAPLPLTATPVP